MNPRSKRAGFLLATVAATALLSLSQATAAQAGQAGHAGPASHHAGSGLSARTTGPAAVPALAGTLRGLDVSGFQGNVNWSTVAANGAKFAYVKATESTNYVSSYFPQQYNGSADAGLIRGAYHFAHPNSSSGAAQADYFISHGGGWSDDGKTLPGALDIEYAPSGDTCYGLSQGSMVSWVSSFVTEYHTKTGRYPAIYSTTDWWKRCTGNSSSFADRDPLWIANYSGSATPLPSGWSSYTIWQNADSGTFPGDQNVFNGTASDLAAFAHGDYTPPPVTSWPLVQSGQTGRQVSTVQYLLNAHGAALTVDGDFGSATTTAVKSFQSAHGLTADGVVGPNTWQALVVTVQAGSTGDAVTAAQAELNAHGAGLTVNGQFDAATTAATTAFQTARHLTADGIVGPDTWQALLN
ncbi:MAG: GH25 family lysozyme [Actinocatenispora sp.]